MSSSEHTHASWRRADIQGLRAIAILLVVAFHAGLPLPGGFVGVDVFFVISGFVIAQLIMRQQERRFALRTFYYRRMRRLLPALALMITVALVAAIFIESPFGPQRTAATTGIGASLFVANFVIYATTGGYFDAPAEINPLLHTWSLSVEEQFYFIFPALMVLAAAWGAASVRRRRMPALVLIGTMSVLSFLASVALGYNLISPAWLANAPAWAFYASPTRAWEFGAGAFAAIVLAARTKPFTRGYAESLGVLGLILIAFSAVAISETDVFPGIVATVPVAGTLALLTAGIGQPPKPEPFATRILSTTALVWIGALSYSWYLWHWPIIVFTHQLAPGDPTAIVIAAVASLIPAWLAYRYVENPIRTSTSLSRGRTVTIIGAAVAIPIATGVLVIFGAERGWGNSAIVDMSDQVEPLPISYLNGCDEGIPLGQQQNLKCTWGAAITATNIFLVGDSQAGQFAEATISAGEQLGSSVTIATDGSCPFLLTLPGEKPVQDPRCEAFVRDSIDWLKEQDAATVIIGMSSNYFTPESQAVASERLLRSVLELTKAGHDVFVFEPIPQFPGWSPSQCTLLEVSKDSRGCGTSTPRLQMDLEQAVALSTFEQVALDSPATLIDTRDALCNADTCATNTGGTWQYRDMFHITVGESQRFAPHLVDALTSPRQRI